MKKTAANLLGVFALTALICGSKLGAQTAAAREVLVWSDEFNSAGTQSQPNPSNWTYDAGAGGWGNGELETYCAWGSPTAPCTAAQSSSFVGDDGFLHIVAQSLGSGVYTSARLKTEGLRSFRYGRVEARIRIPEGRGIWPAFWMLGDDIEKVGWPACGELDIMEVIGKEPSVVHGSVHMPGGDGTGKYTLPEKKKLAEAFHIYGLEWSPGRIQYYLDSPNNVYVSYTPADLPKTAVWPFDGSKFFVVLNLAVGGRWPGNPDATTKFPREMLVDYVRVYQRQAENSHEKGSK
jgi:beta-glucanase (GH16 family)